MPCTPAQSLPPPLGWLATANGAQRQSNDAPLDVELAYASAHTHTLPLRRKPRLCYSFLTHRLAALLSASHRCVSPTQRTARPRRCGSHSVLAQVPARCLQEPFPVVCAAEVSGTHEKQRHTRAPLTSAFIGSEAHRPPVTAKLEVACTPSREGAVVLLFFTLVHTYTYTHIRTRTHTRIDSYAHYRVAALVSLSSSG